MTTIKTTCKIGACEPFCGLEVEVEDGKMVSVKPDKDHPITKGYACIKGMHVADYQNDPDRLLYPEKKSGDDFERVTWDSAYEDIGKRLRELHDTYGPGSIATYWGNAADSASIMLANTFCHAFGSANSFNVLSLEYTDRGAVAERVLGNENFILQPDAGRSHYALLLGTNPLVTQGMTLLQRRPHILADFKAIKKAGGKVVVVDPRETETARVAQEHLAIRPGTDLFFLLGLIHAIIESGHVDGDFIDQHCSGFDTLCALSAGINLNDMARITDIPAETMERIGKEFAQAESGFVTTRVGVQTSKNSTLTEWAVMTLNAITGNIDRPGGVYFNPGAIDVPGLIEKFTKRKNTSPSRIGKYPQIFGGPPASVFAEDVLSDDPDRIRALIVVAGNPVLTFPNTPRVEEALQKLDLLVSIDIYRSDTGSFADYNLPAQTMFEKGAFHFLTSNFESHPFAELKPKVAEPRGETRSEWDIFMALSREAKVPFLNNPLVDIISKGLGLVGKKFTESMLYDYLLLGKGGLRRLKRHPEGVTYAEINWGDFLKNRISTPDNRIRLTPEDLVQAIEKELLQPPLPTEEYPLLLVSGARRLQTFNTWTHNIPALMKLVKGNWATMNPEDARTMGIEEGQEIQISTTTGSISIPVKCSDRIRPGVVSVHQFWGHKYNSGMKTSRKYPGVNVNELHDDAERDPFTGMPVYNARPCRIESVSVPAS